MATARFYEPGVTERTLMTDREMNLRVGFRFLNDLLGKFDHDTHLALLAYNRGPAKVADILAQGGDPTNGYSDAVLEGYRAPSSAPRLAVARRRALAWNPEGDARLAGRRPSTSRSLP